MDSSDGKYDFRRYSFLYATRIFERYKHRKHSICNNARNSVGVCINIGNSDYNDFSFKSFEKPI